MTSGERGGGPSGATRSETRETRGAPREEAHAGRSPGEAQRLVRSPFGGEQTAVARQRSGRRRSRSTQAGSRKHRPSGGDPERNDAPPFNFRGTDDSWRKQPQRAGAARHATPAAVIWTTCFAACRVDGSCLTTPSAENGLVRGEAMARRSREDVRPTRAAFGQSEEAPARCLPRRASSKAGRADRGGATRGTCR